MILRKVNYMAVLPPELQEKLRDEYLEEMVDAAVSMDEDIENCSFYGETMPECTERIEFRGCRFEKCDLRALTTCHASFVDCVLDHCDLSGAVLEKGTMQRVHFLGCRLTGVRFSEGTLMNVLFEDCQMDYESLDKEKVQHVCVSRCTLKESMFIECKWSDLVLSDCVLDGSEFARFPLKGMDLSACRFTHLRVDVNALRGLKVTREQAMSLSMLLGLVIAD